MRIPVEKAIPFCKNCENLNKREYPHADVCYCRVRGEKQIPLGYFTLSLEFVVCPDVDFEPPHACPYKLDFLMISEQIALHNS